MKISCGTDVIEIARIEKAIENHGKKFLETIYTPKEIEYCETKGKMKYQSYAARFAGKEAIFKAISIFLKYKFSISWNDVEILDQEQGKPQIVFLKHQFKEIKSMDISLSHCRDYATANVVVLYKE